MNTKQHYDNHLGNFFSWMIGDFDTRQNEQSTFFKSHNILPHENRTAIDLGCGNGIQSIALAKSGFNVIAFDFCKQLLSELRKRIGDLSIIIYETNILNFEDYIETQAELICCMGDTIAHLSSIDEVQQIIRSIHSVLTDSGKVVLSFRDYSTALENENRFIPVKADDSRIFTCFLEYYDDKINVTDILYSKENGQWIQKISSYQKVRISEKKIKDLLSAQGFKIDSCEALNGFVYVIASKK